MAPLPGSARQWLAVPAVLVVAGAGYAVWWTSSEQAIGFTGTGGGGSIGMPAVKSIGVAVAR